MKSQISGEHLRERQQDAIALAESPCDVFVSIFALFKSPYNKLSAKAIASCISSLYIAKLILLLLFLYLQYSFWALKQIP